MSFDQKINELLIRETMSKRKLHQLTGFSRSTIARWAHGLSEPTNESKKILAEVFKVPVTYFEDSQKMFFEQQINDLQEKVEHLEKKVLHLEHVMGVL